MQNPTDNHWSTCKRILRYLKDTMHLGLYMISSTDTSQSGYADADWASSVDDRDTQHEVTISF